MLALSPGTRLDGYEVLSIVGSGGMGEVYRARDTRLGRDIALKILPTSFKSDPERLTRFRREAQLLASLRRRNVIAGYREHTAGSFVVELAPISALFEAPKRRREKTVPPAPDPRALKGLDEETRRQLRTLAVTILQNLGVHSPTKRIVEDEMLRQFTALAAGIPEGPDREALLQQAIARALEENDA